MDVLDRLPNALGLTSLEVASGFVFGSAKSGTEIHSTGLSPRDALEQIVLERLSTSQVFVAFSGGRDSSAILALATAVARREGLPLPVPISQRYTGIAEADEREWQELVVRHLELDEWQCVLVEEETDVLGELALDAVRRFGPLFPMFGHHMIPTYRAAAGGVLLRGEGGDEMFDDRRGVDARRLVSRAARKPTAANAKSLGFALAPARVRRRRPQNDGSEMFGWLTPDARAEVTRSVDEYFASEPLRWKTYLCWLTRQRFVQVAHEMSAMVAAHEGTKVVDPLYEQLVLGALTARRGHLGYKDRTHAYREMFGDLLPERVITRQSKASFNDAVFRQPSRTFAEQWDGTGLDEGCVDPDELRREWASERPQVGALALLQLIRLGMS